MSTDGGHEFLAGRLVPEVVVSAVNYRWEQDAPSLHRGAPSPALTLVFSLDEPIVAGFSPEDAFGANADTADVVLGGLHTRPAYIAQPKIQTGVQLAIRPFATRAVFGLPAREITEQSVNAVDVLGSDAERLRERMSELPAHQRFSVLERYFRERLANPLSKHEPREDVVEAWKWIAWHRGNGSISELARHVHLSQRQLKTIFTAELGLSPKAVSRLMRFEHARQRITRAVGENEPLDLATTAQACGYYDHSHLVRDFGQYMGINPSGWVDEEFRNIQAGATQISAEFEP